MLATALLTVALAAAAMPAEATSPSCPAGGCEAWTADLDNAPVKVALAGDGSRLFTLTTPGAKPTVTALDTADGTETWSRSHDIFHLWNSAVAADPTGDVVVVAANRFTGCDYVGTFCYFQTVMETIAFDQADGTILWAHGIDHPSTCGACEAESAATVVSPDGDTVYTVGHILENGWGRGLLLAAYDADSGSERWRTIEPVAGVMKGTAVAVSPDSGTVFVSGWQRASKETFVVALDADTGAVDWSVRTSELAPWPGADLLATDGDVVAVASRSGDDYVIGAYDASDGAERWMATYDNGETDDPVALAMTPDGSAVVVAGNSGDGANRDWATVAFDAADGSQSWAARLNGGGNGADTVTGLAIAPGAGAVYTAGTTVSVDGETQWTVMAYDPANGVQQWRADRAGGNPRAGVVADDGRAYAAGTGGDEPGLVVAYEAALLGGLPDLPACTDVLAPAVCDTLPPVPAVPGCTDVLSPSVCDALPPLPPLPGVPGLPGVPAVPDVGETCGMVLAPGVCDAVPV